MSKIMKKYQVKKSSKSTQAENPGIIVEADQPLSQSLVWKLQADFYANQGPEAWIKGIVPQYITTNPYIANLYAKTVFGYCRDIAACEDFDRSTTIYILELAAGVGRFTYTFLKRFLHILENSSLKGLKFKYIITDLAERNVTYWRNHSYLEPYFESGLLDCATFDMTRDKELHLSCSGEVLSAGNLHNPLILIANYTFDSLPQDTFYVKDGDLYEGLITVTSKDETVSSRNGIVGMENGAVGSENGIVASENRTLDSENGTAGSENRTVDSKDQSILSGLDYSYTDRLITGRDYYEESLINDILLYYKDCLEDTAFSLPIAAIRCLERLRRLFNDDILLISTDKGYRDTFSMDKNYHPFLSKHGSISLTVNFHALELYFSMLGGKAIHSLYNHENVTMSSFLLSKRSHNFMETSLAYREIIEGIGADDFFLIKKALVPHSKSLTTKELLTFLRYTVWDSRTFIEFYNTLLERIDEEKDFPRDELVDVIQHIRELYFPIGEEGDLSYCLGSLLSYLGYDMEAVELYHTSLEFYGEDASIYYEIAVCYYNVQQTEIALAFIEKSLSLDPEYEASLTLKSIIEEL